MSARNLGAPTPQRVKEPKATPARHIPHLPPNPSQNQSRQVPSEKQSQSHISQPSVSRESDTFETPTRLSNGLFSNTLKRVWGNGQRAGESAPTCSVARTSGGTKQAASANSSQDSYEVLSNRLESASIGRSDVGCQRQAGKASSYEADRDAKSQEVVYTTSNGGSVPHPYIIQRAGLNGPVLLQDFHLIDLLSHFDRERIPERVVHAKGSGAHGFWECTDGLDDLCLADMFKKGVQCPITARFSTVGGESGSPDLARDPRGFAVKFKTSEGNWDFVANNTPVFFLRDPAKFPAFIHTQKRHPATHLGSGDDSTMFWDYLSQNPESIHQLMILMGDRGIPDGWRHMHGYYGHTLKLVNAKSEWVYVQFHLISDQGVKTFTAQEAATKSADYGQKDLYEAIERGEFPTWTMKIQVMSEQEAETAWEQNRINVFDLTHVWPHKEYPLRTVGRITLNTNARNVHAEVEQAAYNPAHMVPGIEPSADPVLQARMFSYPDAHRHRIGANYQQLPVNQPVCPFAMGNFQRDGQMAFFNQGERPAYLSSIEPIRFQQRGIDLDKVHGNFNREAVSYLSEICPEDFKAPRALWERVFSEEAKARFIATVSGHMSTCKRSEIIARQITIFRHVSRDLASRLEKATGIRGYETIEGMSFNGTHNGFGAKRPANGMRREADTLMKNMAIQRGRAR